MTSVGGRLQFEPDEDVLAVPIDDRYETEHKSSGFPEERESGLLQRSRFSSDRHIGFIKVLQHSEDISDRCPVAFSGLFQYDRESERPQGTIRKARQRGMSRLRCGRHARIELLSR